MANTTVAIESNDLEMLHRLATKDSRTIKACLGLLIQREFKSSGL